MAMVEQGDGLGVAVEAPYAEVVARVRESLAEQGFGVLTEIDLRATLRAKLGEQAGEMEEYLVLGACNPSLAHRALAVDRRIGLLLPCNVVVRTEGGRTLVEAADPQLMVGFTGRPELAPVADEAAGRLRAALAALIEPAVPNGPAALAEPAQPAQPAEPGGPSGL